MKEIAALPAALALVLRRAGARPFAAAAASGLVGVGVVFLLDFGANAVPQAEWFFALALFLTAVLIGVAFRGIAAAAFVIALTVAPSVREACALFRRNIFLLAVLEVLRVVAAGWVGFGYGLLLEAFAHRALEAFALVVGGVLAAAAGVWINARYGPEHRDGIAVRVQGHVPLLLASSAIPFLLVAATLGAPPQLDLVSRALPEAVLLAPRIVVALLAVPCAIVLDAALGAAAYGIITGRLRAAGE